jgi:hypothetical protein
VTGVADLGDVLRFGAVAHALHRNPDGALRYTSYCLADLPAPTGHTHTLTGAPMAEIPRPPDAPHPAADWLHETAATTGKTPVSTGWNTGWQTGWIAGYAARDAELDDNPHHIIEFRAGGWTIKHPLSCRPRLFDCAVNRLAEQQVDGPPQGVTGRFEVGVNDLGDRLLIGDRIDQP